MAATSEFVKHALLALSATYVLDYQPTEAMQSRANLHFKRAVDLLGEALREPTVQEVGKEDAVIGALTLLSLDDVSISFEFVALVIETNIVGRSASTGSCTMPLAKNRNGTKVLALRRQS